ncbi:MAG TPA: ABC transporter permease [Thermoplasmata archaeon]|nr:ABC transporter permease [Thermoplasmata archaeon]
MSAETRLEWLPRGRPATLASDYVGQGRQFYGLYSRELLKTFRNPIVILFTVVQPFMWLAFFGSSFASVPIAQLDALLHAPPGTGYLDFLLPGVLATSMLSIGMFGSMSTIQDKRFGFMKRILLTPTSRATVYLAKALGSATRGMVQVPVMLVAAWAFGVSFHGAFWMWAGYFVGLALLGFGFSAFFLAVTASSTDWQTPGVISNFITMPLMFASGALFPSVNYPVWMQDISAVNPVAFAALLGRGIAVYGAPNWIYLGYLAVFAALMLAAGTLVASRYLKAE